MGFSYQGPSGENCLVYNPDKTIQADLRGFESVEGRLRRALDLLVGEDNYQNIQVSSRTDRGVHAWRNTLQVDIRPRHKGNNRDNQTSSRATKQWKPKNLVDGINFYLCRIPSFPSPPQTDAESLPLRKNIRNKASKANFYNLPLNNNITILSSAVAPDIATPNQNYNPSLPEDEMNPKSLPFDVRFTATRRTYAYRILHSYAIDAKSASYYHSQPFEHDRVWRIHDDKGSICELNINAMNVAATHLVGTHDFTSFRGKGCQRSSPVTTLDEIVVHKERYHGLVSGIMLAGEMENSCAVSNCVSLPLPDTFNMITIIIKGKSFLYHQVRNIVACLVEVGQGRLKPDDVKEILEKKDRGAAPGMAPAQGLILVDVEHGEFRF
jgi:tRNA pseudouridine38-40 synthase